MDVYDYDGMEYMYMPDSDVPSHAFRNPSGQAFEKVLTSQRAVARTEIVRQAITLQSQVPTFVFDLVISLQSAKWH